MWGQKGSRLASGSTFPPQKTNNEGSLSSSYKARFLTHWPASQQDISGLPHTIHTRKHYSIEASSEREREREREYGSLLRVSWCEETNFFGGMVVSKALGGPNIFFFFFSQLFKIPPL